MKICHHQIVPIEPEVFKSRKVGAVLVFVLIFVMHC